MRGQLLSVARYHHFVSAQLLRRFALGFGCSERHNVGAHRVGQLDAHVAQATNADHADFLARKLRACPLGAHLVQVRMADAAKGDIDLNVMGGGCTANDLQRFKGLVARMSTIGLYKHGRVLNGFVG
ncbi:hypothetical protein TMM008_46620 [Pseudomonas sp. 008]|nr:hypothetical protein TMM008_46620 [Pseudomonas sp. 008]